LFSVQQAPAALLDGRLWVAGGLLGPQSATTRTEFYDPTIGTWQAGPPLPVPLHHEMMVVYQGTLWVIGGFVAQGADVLAAASARVLILNTAQNGWITGPPLHHARGAAAAAVVGNKIVVVGGRTAASQQLVTPTEVYDGTSWRDATAIPVPGDHLTAASDSTYLYAAGGHKITETSNTTAVQRFDPATGRWAQLPPMPVAGSGCGLAVIHGKLIIVGGDNGIKVFNAAWVYDLASGTSGSWAALPAMPAARHGVGTATFRNTLYVVGGASQPGHTGPTPTVQILHVHR
jgi:N-acetylneuraminic acid mutarotase